MLTPSECLYNRALYTPDSVPFGVFNGPTLTYREWYKAAGAVSMQMIQERYIEPGSRVLQIANSTNWPEFAILYVALLSSGYTVMTLDRIPEEINDIKDQFNIRAVVSAEKRRVVLDGSTVTKHPLDFDGSIDVEWQEQNWSVGDEAEVLFTSGTTGPRKAIACSWGDICTSLSSSVENPSDRFPDQSVLIHHAVPGGQAAQRILLQALRSNRLSCLAVPDRAGASLFEAAQKTKAKFLGLVPATARRLVDCTRSKGTKLVSVEWVSVGSESVPHSILQDLADICPHAQVMNMYGSTEAGFARICGVYPLNSMCIGKPEPGCHVRILSDEDDVCAAGEVGNLWIMRESSYSRSYVSKSDLNERTFRDGWINTGDMGWVDENKQVYLLGRRSEAIVSQGELVHPFALEEHIRTHPQVRDAAVYVSNAGSLCVAIVLLDHIEVINPVCQSIFEHCRGSLPESHVPVSYVILSEIPVGQFGTVQRRALSTLHDQVSDHEWNNLRLPVNESSLEAS